MKARSQSTRRQGGFTLVEMSVTLAAAGLLFAAVSTGQELIDQAKATKLINDVKSTEMRIQQYAQLKGRMPGDCNADGIIDYAADANTAILSLRSDIGNAARSAEYAIITAVPEMPAVGTAASSELMGCALEGTVGSAPAVSDVAVSPTNANVWINDMKLAGVISDSVPNRMFAKQVNEDFMFVGKVTDAGGATAVGADYNAIVIHNVPQWMARRLATAVNGQDAVANRSRVRLLDRVATDGTYAALWDSTVASTPDNSRDAMTTVVYFFDRIPSTS